MQDIEIKPKFFRSRSGVGRPFEEAAAGLSPNIIQKEDIQRTGPALKKQVSENGILMAVVQKMPKERTKDPESVFGWVKSGGSLAARSCSREIADNIKEGPKEKKISFFAVQKNGRVILIVKDKDEGKLTEAADQARKDKTKKNTILHGTEMNSMTAGKRKLVYLSGLTELEAAGIQKNIDKYSHGIQYSIVEADVEIARHFCRPSLHVLVRHGGKRHQFLSFLNPLIVPAVVLLFEVFMVQCIQFCPKVPVELFQREVAAIFQIMEESFLQDAHSVFYTAFPFVIGNYR